ncbi:MAG TPA: hypothetical protein VNF49_13655 [Candidatus Binataceae bacterium]|nr:hypothetical protein [Candidatus Binataceae bacterium]
MKARRIVVEIEELVLHGFDPRDRYRIGDAMRAELATLLADFEVGTASRAPIARIDAGAFDVPAGAGGGSIGRGLARAVRGSFS